MNEKLLTITGKQCNMDTISKYISCDSLLYTPRDLGIYLCYPHTGQKTFGPGKAGPGVPATWEPKARELLYQAVLGTVSLGSFVRCLQNTHTPTPKKSD